MEKSTKKFLSVLLCVAMLFSFPVVASANTAYDETFKGTYTAPESATNVLISGDDATVTEWYGDRVNAGSHTYSVRQNQYGLNKDGNMIEAKEGTKYTLWLAQYGVASLKFVVPEDGQYVVLTSRSEKYVDKDDLSSWSNWISLLNSNMTLRSWQYHDNTLDKVQYKAHYYWGVTDRQYKGDYFFVTAGADNDRDSVYDIEILNVKDLDKENCPHYSYNFVNEEDIDECNYIYTYECNICGSTVEETGVSHQWEDVVVDPSSSDKDVANLYKAICKNEVVYKRVCSKCGKSLDGLCVKHDLDKVDIISSTACYDEIEYKWECGLCKEQDWDYKTSPCVGDDGEVHHIYVQDGKELDEDYIDWDKSTCKNPIVCKNCGYNRADHYHYDYDTYHEFDKNDEEINCVTPKTCKNCGKKVYGAHEYDYLEKKINSSNGSRCYTYNWNQKCKVCGKYRHGESTPEIEVQHYGWTYVQIKPQTKDTCGTYKMVCEECGEDITKEKTLHTGEWVEGKDGDYWRTCTRCGQVEKYEDSSAIIPGGSTGGSTGGGGGGAPAPAPEPEPEKPAEDPKKPSSNSDTSTTTTTSSSKPATVVVNKPQAKEKAVVVTWKKAKNVSGYEVQLATDKKFKKNKKSIKVKKPSSNKKTVKKLKKNKKYYVRVRSYKIVNGKKVYGKWSKVKSVKTK